MGTATVYILNNHLHDYTAAKKFGELRVVTEGTVPVFKVDRLAQVVRDELQDFKEGDYLVVSGPAVLNMIAITYLLHKFDSVAILVHDAIKKMYVPRDLCKASIYGECLLSKGAI